MLVIPIITFFVLLVAGVWTRDLRIRHVILFVAIWAACLVGFSAMGLARSLLVLVEVALDLVLILMIFGPDFR